MTWQALFGERATTKIAAVFDTEGAACATADSLKDKAGLQSTQVLLVGPDEKEYAKKLEPEPQGIIRTAIRSHLLLGLAGLVAGGLLWMAFYSADIPAIQSSRALSALAFLFFGAVAGLLLGGLLTSRPDHQLVIQRVQTAIDDGHWSLIIHPRNERECDAVMVSLAESGAEIVRSV
ncbi:hypothetical protein EKL30_14845 [Candidimonas sp. SYP-B2681]|uniref:hypothetical protein n=1 Tax=Candidimonas sp. SYP-B2681 TaxID=2497686 RepID=UPI000F8792A1|nr:hypothetical protein [Candidimonas sp. SYP-B2681]RTZ40969.1 hypothetical protein EKL30_14845 [Candidimonas sp. SYP-B2681]